MTRALVLALNVVVAGLLGLGVVSPIAAQEAGDATFPASAVIRGENIWLRVEPAAVSEVVAVLQRGEPVTLTTDAVAGDGYMFYPVTVDATGASGWVRELFINHRSIVPLDVPPAADVPAEAPEAVADEEETPEERRERRNRDRDAAADAPAVEEAAPAETAPVPVEEPVAEPAAAPEDIPAEDAEAPPAEAPPAEEPAPPPADAGATPALASLSGVGALLTEPFPLEAGRYRAVVTVEAPASSSFSAMLYGPGGFSELLFNEPVATNEPWTAETVVRIAEGGEFTIDVTNTEDAWTIQFEPRQGQ